MTTPSVLITKNSASRSKTLAGILLLLCASLLYASTLDNGLMQRELEGGDLITHQYAQVQARQSNAPGYPVYTMGGWLWFHGIRSALRVMGVSLPNPILILSSYSTLWALLSLWLFYQILCHVTRTADTPTGNWLVAWLLSAFYAVTFFFWFYATTTEQYSSAIAHTLAIVYVYLKWESKTRVAVYSPVGFDRLSPRGSTRLPTRRQEDKEIRNDLPLFLSPYLLVFLSFLCGLSLAHMLTVAFIVPPLVLLVLWDAPWLLRRPWLVVGVIGAAALPLLSYTYVYIRGAAHPEWWGKGDWSTGQEWFWAFVRTSQGWEELGWGLEAGRTFWGGGFPELMWQELSIPLFAIGLIGIGFLNRRLTILLYSTFAIYLLFCWGYRFGNWFQVILPAYSLILMGVAALANRWWHWKPTVEPSTTSTSTTSTSTLWRRGLLVFALVALIIWRGTVSFPNADSRNRAEDQALDRAAILLAAPLPRRAALFGTVEETLAIQYLTQIWGIRPDLKTVSSPKAAALLEADGMVYVTNQSALRLYSELPAKLDSKMAALNPDWVLLSTKEQASLDEYQKPNVLLNGEVDWGVQLVGYQITAGSTGAPVYVGTEASLDIVLFWALSEEGWPGSVSISVRPLIDGALVTDPVGEAGAIIQQDASQPMHGLLSWGAGPAVEGLVADAYRIKLPVQATSTVDEIQVLLYRPVDGGFETVAEYRLEALH